MPEHSRRIRKVKKLRKKIGTMERKEDKKHGGRAYNNRAGHIKAIRLAALILIIPFQFGCHLLVQRCPPGEGAFAKPIEPADSIALDIVHPHSKFDHRGCGLRSGCMAELLSQEDRQRFVEVFVHKPGADHLSKKKGWYRYWITLAGDADCALFYASEKAQKDWHDWFSELYTNPSRIDPDAICIASKKIKEPESRYLYRERDDKRREPGLTVWRHDLIDRQTGEIRVHWQRSNYRDAPHRRHSSLYRYAYRKVVRSISKLSKFFTGSGLEEGSCTLPNEDYKLPSYKVIYPKSSLGPLSDDWPALPAAPSPPLPTDSAK